MCFDFRPSKHNRRGDCLLSAMPRQEEAYLPDRRKYIPVRLNKPLEGTERHQRDCLFLESTFFFNTNQKIKYLQNYFLWLSEENSLTFTVHTHHMPPYSHGCQSSHLLIGPFTNLTPFVNCHLVSLQADRSSKAPNPPYPTPPPQTHSHTHKFTIYNILSDSNTFFADWHTLLTCTLGDVMLAAMRKVTPRLIQW